MIAFAWNLTLALAWVILTGSFTAANLVWGFIVAYFVLRLTHRRNPDFEAYFARVPQAARFALFFMWDLTKSNIRVAYDVLTPTHYMRPGVIALPLDARTDAEITALANLITVTPGALALDVSSDRRVLYIHLMYLDDEQRLREELKDLERRVLQLMR